MTKVNSCIIFGYVDVKLDGLFLKELHIKIVHSIFERELRIVEWFESLCKLRCLSVVVVKINSDKGNQSLLMKEEFLIIKDMLKCIELELCILDGEIKHIFISFNFTFVCNC